MKMSTKGRYGLRLMVCLAARYGQGPIGVEVIADEQAISPKYIHVLMGSLKTAGLIRSHRGRDGGYELARKPDAITAFEVVSALEGRTLPADCVAEPGICSRVSICPTRQVWCQMANAIDAVLKGITLENLLETSCGPGQQLHYCI